VVSDVHGCNAGGTRNKTRLSRYAKIPKTVTFSIVFLDKPVQQRATESSSKSAPLTWVDVLSLPLPTNKDRSHAPLDKEETQHR